MAEVVGNATYPLMNGSPNTPAKVNNMRPEYQNLQQAERILALVDRLCAAEPARDQRQPAVDRPAMALALLIVCWRRHHSVDCAPAQTSDRAGAAHRRRRSLQCVQIEVQRM
jgi:hypothetical protein